jgi:hypothetical protein
MDSVPKIMMNCIFHEMKRSYLYKNRFHGFLKSTTVVEIACIFHILKVADKDSDYENLNRAQGLPIEQLIPRQSLNMLKEDEWRQKIESFLNKNAYLKK